MHKIQVTDGDGITFLDQKSFIGKTNTLVVSTKQFAEIVWFLTQPKSASFRTSDKVLDDVVVRYSSNDERYTLTQGDLKLVGSRNDENYSFSQVVLWMKST